MDDEGIDALLTICGAPEPFNQADVYIAREGADAARSVRGAVTAARMGEGRWDVAVAGRLVFVLDRAELLGGWLHTVDGNDYYDLQLDLGWGVVQFNDGYN